jgi:hypothetical protein
MKFLKHKFIIVIAAMLLSSVGSFMLPGQASAVCSPDSDVACPGEDAVAVCITKWNNKGGSGSNPDKKYSEYKSSGCDDSDGGPCKVTVSTEGEGQSFIIHCTNPSDTNNDNSGTGTTDLGSLGQEQRDGDCKGVSFQQLNEDNCGILKILIVVTNVLSAIAAVVIIMMIIIGGIQYSMAGPDPGKVQAAKQKIINAIIALLLFIFGFALLQWLVPGGIL